jgi:hypothetical protein
VPQRGSHRFFRPLRRRPGAPAIEKPNKNGPSMHISLYKRRAHPLS